MRRFLPAAGPRHTPLLAGTGITCLAIALVVGLVTLRAQSGAGTPPHDLNASTHSRVADGITLGLAPLPASEPTRIRIPAIHITSPLTPLGLNADGTLQVPTGAYPAGWFTGAPTPGETGPAIIAGHVSYNGVAGVFADLHQLRAGDKIVVSRADGSTAVFGVAHVEHFTKTHFPSARVYGNIERPGLRLITCGGFNAVSDTYLTNVVVFADLIASH